jgi:glucose-1-phosphate thymidylyltransferase
MKGVMLAGGVGSRLMPLTTVTNKHLLPVGRKPMILHPLGKMVEAGVTDIMIVTGREHMGAMLELLGSGREFGAQFTFRVQDEAGGIAQALLLAEGFAAGGPVLVILGDNIFTASLTREVRSFARQEHGARILLKEVPDPHRFGVAELSADGRSVIGIEEKPAAPKTRFAVTGIYLYDAQVFGVIRTLKPSGRGELEITDVNNYYVRSGWMTWGLLDGEWSDAGTFESLARANQMMADGEADALRGCAPEERG